MKRPSFKKAGEISGILEVAGVVILLLSAPVRKDILLIIGAVVLIAGIACDFAFVRCPNCGKHVKFRPAEMKCKYCGAFLSPEKEEMYRIANGIAEAEPEETAEADDPE